MKAGGTFDLDAQTNDIGQIVDGNYPTSSLIQLPIQPTAFSFAQGGFGGELGEGARPDLNTPDSAANPIAGNPAIAVTRFNLQQPANLLQLIWSCLDANGNYQTSYPINDIANMSTDAGGQAASVFLGQADFAAAITNTRWAYGWIRLNGQGVWHQMSLLPVIHHAYAPQPAPQDPTINTGFGWGGLAIRANGGHSSIAGPIAFFDWIGYCDGEGSVLGPNGDNSFILAIATANLSLGSAEGTLGGVAGYSLPNSSGIRPGAVAGTTVQRQNDILTPMRGTKRPCP